MRNKEKIKYTLKHKAAFLKVEKELLGKNTIRGYLHDLDKVILCLLRLMRFCATAVNDYELSLYPFREREGSNLINEYMRKQEIIAVKELGEAIGYGNLMDIASALWAMKLSSDGVERIMHVPTVEPCMKKEEWERTREQILGRIEELKSYGINFN